MFHLHKWYLDVVADDGAALILYSARVEWGRLAVDYASVLDATGSVTREEQTLRRVEHPQVTSGDALSWRSDPLAVEGTWIRDAAPIQRTLADGPDGTIAWSCHMPRARATVTVDGRRIDGFGYVESLDLTMAPSKLPFRTLRWGRHLSRHHSLIWIDWTGDPARRWMWLDGEEQTAATFVEGAPSTLTGGNALRFHDWRDVRDRDVLGSVRGLPPALMRRIGGGLAAMHEHKMLSRSSIVASGQAIDEGWTLHEVVTR